MLDPWRPIAEMDHDEVRRYVNELLVVWANAGAPLPREQQHALIDRVEEVELRIKALGLEPMLSLKAVAL